MPYLSLIIFLPLVGAFVIALLPKDNVKAVKWAAVLFTAASLALSLAVFFQFDPGKTDPQFQFQHRFIWVENLGIQYNVGVDGLSLPMVALTTFLSFVAVLGSWVPIKFREKEYYALFLILETGILGVFSSLDLLLFFLFWEVELIPMFLLIAIWGGPRREKAATKFVMYTLAGSALMLVGILALYFSSEPRTFDMLALANTSLGRDFQIAVFLLMFAGFAIKLPVVPLHTSRYVGLGVRPAA